MNGATFPMGAIPVRQGVSFRIWAPFASSVSVKGNFNNWSETANLLTDEGSGYWSTIVPNAKVGDEYKFILANRSTGERLEKNDPYAREVTNSAGNGVYAIGNPNTCGS